MIHRQQEGCLPEDILAGLCKALVRGYLNNLAVGKRLLEPILFQGGVAGNTGIKAAFEEELEVKLTVPRHYDVMGAYGAALLAAEHINEHGGTAPKQPPDADGWSVKSHPCEGCANRCSIVTVLCKDELKATLGGRCSGENRINYK